MKPRKAPIAAPDPNVAVRERAPLSAPVTQMRAASPAPIQKMAGIKWAPYRTDKGGGIHERPLNSPAMTTAPAKNSKLILAAMIFAVSMTFIDQTIVAISLPTIQQDVHLSTTGSQWIINGYLP